MSSATRNASKQLRKPRKKLSLEVKLDILRRINAGERKSEVCKALSLAESTVRTIVKYSEKIKERSSRASSASTTAQSANYRSPIVVEMERLLSIWIQENSGQDDQPISNCLIQEKAKSLYNELWPNYYTDCDPVLFKASLTWLQRFKLRAKLHHPVAKLESKTFKNELMHVIEDGGYSWQQIFNVDQTVLYWKRMAPWNNSSSRSQKVIHGLPACNESLTLLLGGNAAGDFKLKPMVVYHLENPPALRGYSKTRLPVIWKSNAKSRITRQVFESWFCDYFSPAVEKYCSSNNLPNKALLMLDDDPSHPTNLEDICPNVKVVFFPRNASVFKPIHQGVTTTFKAYYLRKTFSQACRATESDDCNMATGFWKTFNILGAIDNIASAWDEIPAKILNGAWTKMYDDCDTKVLGDVDFQEAEELVDTLKKDIIDIVKNICNNEITPQDVQFLLDLQQDELCSDETMGNKRQNDGGYDDDDDTEKVLSADILAKALKGMEEVIGILQENDPNRERSYEAAKKIENAISCYRAMYSEKQKCKKRCMDAAANSDQRKGKTAAKESSEADAEPSADDAAVACIVNSPVNNNLERYDPLSPSCVIILQDIQQT